MNCCDDYGQCQRGPDCPAGSTPLITRQGLHHVPPTGQPHADKSHTEVLDKIAYWCCIAIASTCTLAVCVGGGSYLWFRYLAP